MLFLRIKKRLGLDNKEFLWTVSILGLSLYHDIFFQLLLYKSHRLDIIPLSLDFLFFIL